MQYTTLENLKDYLGVTGNSHDEELTKLIEIGTDLIDLELGGNLGQETITRRVDGNGSNRLYLETIPNSVSEVAYTTNDGYTWTGVDLSPDPIDGYTVYVGAILAKGNRNVKITYSKGYTSAPTDLEEFFLLYLKKLKDNREIIERGGDTTNVIKSQKAEGLTVTYFSPEEIAIMLSGDPFAIKYNEILKKYRIFNYHITL